MSGFSGCQGDVADGNQSQFDAGISEVHTVAGANSNTLLNSFTVDERAEGAVIEQYQLIPVTHERAVAPGNTGEAIGQCDVSRRLCRPPTDHEQLGSQ